jgi:hypothetical protein
MTADTTTDERRADIHGFMGEAFYARGLAGFRTK